jgi:type IV pilus assembly protein PilX
MINQRSLTPSITKRQSGVVLAISLIILMALTLIGVTSSNVTGLQEKMTANAKDVNLAFQAAEAALRATEDGLLNNKPAFVCNATAGNVATGQGVGGSYTALQANGSVSETGILTPPSPGKLPAIPYYFTVDWSTKTNPLYATYSNVLAGGKKLVGLFRDPEFIVEQLSIAAAGGSSGNGSLEAGGPIGGTAGSVHTFRTTAHGWGSNGNSVATVQSIIKITYTAASAC